MHKESTSESLSDSLAIYKTLLIRNSITQFWFQIKVRLDPDLVFLLDPDRKDQIRIGYWFGSEHALTILKVPKQGTKSRDVRPFFCCLKDSTWAPYNQAKTFANFFVFAKIFDHKVRKSRVHVVNDYADTVSTRSTTISACVRVVVSL